MARFGINPKNTLGVSIPILRQIAKEIGKNPSFAKATEDKHQLALHLWDSKIHEARILAALVENPNSLTKKQMDAWAKESGSWDICDQLCNNLFDKMPLAFQKATEWSKRKEEFIKRAGFVLMAVLSVHNKKAGDEEFLKFFS